MMNSTLGAPSLARSGSGQAGSDWSTVRPMTPVKAVPGLYSFSAMIYLLKEWLVYVVAFDDQCLLLDHSITSAVIAKIPAKILKPRKK
jgi:hypothetical protein